VADADEQTGPVGVTAIGREAEGVRVGCGVSGLWGLWWGLWWGWYWWGWCWVCGVGAGWACPGLGGVGGAWSGGIPRGSTVWTTKRLNGIQADALLRFVDEIFIYSEA